MAYSTRIQQRKISSINANAKSLWWQFSIVNCPFPSHQIMQAYLEGEVGSDDHLSVDL